MRIPEAVWTIGLSIAAIGVIFVAYPHIAPHGSSRSDDLDGVGNAASTSASEWTLGESTDPMTDAHTAMASRDFRGDGYVIQTSIKCIELDTLIYEFNAFDGNENGVPMTSQPDALALRLMSQNLLPVGPVIRFLARVDQESAKTGTVFNPKYSNALSIGAKTTGMNSTQMAAAQRLLVRLPLRGGDKTIEIDQSDSNVASVLQECHFRQEPPGTEEFNGPQGDEDRTAPIPQELLDMGYAKPGILQTGVVVLSRQDFSTVGSTVQTEWLGKVLSRDGDGITVGLQLVQPQMWYYAVLHHSCKRPTDYRWLKFWIASPDRGEGELSLNGDAARRANEESLQELPSNAYEQLCSAQQ